MPILHFAQFYCKILSGIFWITESFFSESPVIEFQGHIISITIKENSSKMHPRCLQKIVPALVIVDSLIFSSLVVSCSSRNSIGGYSMIFNEFAIEFSFSNFFEVQEGGYQVILPFWIHHMLRQLLLLTCFFFSTEQWFWFVGQNFSWFIVSWGSVLPIKCFHMSLLLFLNFVLDIA